MNPHEVDDLIKTMSAAHNEKVANLNSLIDTAQQTYMSRLREQREEIEQLREQRDEAIRLLSAARAEATKWADWHKFTDSGLAEYIAEAQKPLVDALQKMSMVGVSDNDKKTVDAIVAMRAALEKVKEVK